VIEKLISDGFSRIRVGGKFKPLKVEMNDVNFDLIIDRFTIKNDLDFINQISDSIQTAFNEINRECWVDIFDNDKIIKRYFSQKLEADGIKFEAPSMELFNFNSPIGACETCEGFGKILGISEDLVIPDKNLSVHSDCVAPWRGPKLSEWRKQLIHKSHFIDFPVHTPYKDLSNKEKDYLWNGSDYFQGIHAFFNGLQEKIYKIQNRVLISRYKGKTDCIDCKGQRLKKQALAIKINDKNISEITEMTIDEAYQFVQNINFSKRELKIAKRLLDEIVSRLAFLTNVGVGYISLNRLSNTLSGGESQRINLASRLGSKLVGALYVLDEPSIGLHPEDTSKLIEVLKGLNKIGNTVVVVEHDEEIMRSANYIIDIGPKAGLYGGEVVFQGDHKELLQSNRSLTTEYLNGNLKIDIPLKKEPTKFLTLQDCNSNNLSIKKFVLHSND
jgi:excinuclease ABC subunit A